VMDEKESRVSFEVLFHTTHKDNTGNKNVAYLLTSSLLDEIRLGYNLDSIILVGIECCTQVDLGKTTTTQQSSPQIAVQRVPVTIGPPSLFFNHDIF